MKKKNPASDAQMAAMASYAVACPDCPAGPYEPCVFVFGSRKGKPRDQYECTHRWRQAVGDRALAAWRKHQWPNTNVPQVVHIPDLSNVHIEI